MRGSRLPGDWRSRETVEADPTGHIVARMGSAETPSTLQHVGTFSYSESLEG